MQIFQMIKSLLSNKHHQAWTSDRIFTSIYLDLHKEPTKKKEGKKMNSIKNYIFGYQIRRTWKQDLVFVPSKAKKK